MHHLYVSGQHGGQEATVDLVKDVSLKVEPGESVGLLGASGAGKTLTSLSVMRLLPPELKAQGEITWDRTSLLSVSHEAMAALRGVDLAMTVQEPRAALNPLLTVGAQVVEAACARRSLPPADALDLATKMLDALGISDASKRLKEYPHQWSQGMRARALLCAALLVRPRLLIADEPTSALDASSVQKVLAVLEEARSKHAMGVLLVTHDWGVALTVCQRVYVMLDGRVVEAGPAHAVLRQPRHPYTAQLRADALRNFKRPARSLELSSTGCPYRPNCGKATPQCAETMPALEAGGDRRQVACYHPEA